MIMAVLFIVAGTICFIGGLARAVIVTYEDSSRFWPWIAVAVSGMALQLAGIGVIPS